MAVWSAPDGETDRNGVKVTKKERETKCNTKTDGKRC